MLAEKKGHSVGVKKNHELPVFSSMLVYTNISEANGKITLINGYEYGK